MWLLVAAKWKSGESEEYWLCRGDDRSSDRGFCRRLSHFVVHIRTSHRNDDVESGD